MWYIYRKVLQKLREHQLFAKASKCEIAYESIEFLGQQVTPARMSPTKVKIKAMWEWDTPQDVKDVRSFLGFANYYWRYVHQFAEVAHPLTELTKKGVEWQWGPYQKEAFCQLKQKLCEASILWYPDPKLPYTVVTDASGAAMGGVLMQDQGEGLQPLAFMSKALKPSERRSSAYEHELADVAYCFLPWRHYLEGCPGGVTVMANHQPLTLIMQQATLSRTQTRWVRLGFFRSIQPTIVYQPRKANILADALSRSKWVELDAIHSMMIDGDQVEESAMMTRSSIVATEEVNI